MVDLNEVKYVKIQPVLEKILRHNNINHFSIMLGDI